MSLLAAAVAATATTSSKKENSVGNDRKPKVWGTQDRSADSPATRMRHAKKKTIAIALVWQVFKDEYHQRYR
jgi:hypothetical protein